MAQEFKIDFNQTTDDLLNSQAGGFFGRNFTTLMYAHVNHQPVSSQYEGYTDPTQVKKAIEYNNAKGDASNARLTELQYSIYSDLQNPKWDEFFRYWDFIQVLFPDRSNVRVDKTRIMLILNKLNVFSEEVQLKILKRIRYNHIEDPELLQSIMVKIANNPKASPYDKANAACDTHNRDIVRDAIEDLKKALNAELQKDFTNIDEIERICGSARMVIQSMQNHLEETYRNQRRSGTPANDPEMQYILTVLDEFNIDKILSVGTKYIPQINQSLEERAIQAENELANNKLRAQQNNQIMQNQHSQDATALAAEQQKNERLTQQLDELQQKFNRQGTFIETLKMKIAKLKLVGLMGRGKAIEELAQFSSSFEPQR